MSCKHTGGQILWGEGRWFFFFQHNQVALFTWAYLLTKIMFSIEFFLHFFEKLCIHIYESDKICKNQLSGVISHDQEWVKCPGKKGYVISMSKCKVFPRFFIVYDLFIVFFPLPLLLQGIDIFFIQVY